MKHSIIAMSALFVLGACASSEPPVGAQATATTVAEGADGEALEVVAVPSAAKTAAAPKSGQRDRLVCKRVRITGSHRMEKVCRFQSEIDEERKAAQQAIRDASIRTTRTINQ